MQTFILLISWHGWMLMTRKRSRDGRQDLRDLLLRTRKLTDTSTHVYEVHLQLLHRLAEKGRDLPDLLQMNPANNVGERDGIHKVTTREAGREETGGETKAGQATNGGDRPCGYGHKNLVDLKASEKDKALCNFS